MKKYGRNIAKAIRDLRADVKNRLHCVVLVSKPYKCGPNMALFETRPLWSQVFARVECFQGVYPQVVKLAERLQSLIPGKGKRLAHVPPSPPNRSLASRLRQISYRRLRFKPVKSGLADTCHISSP